jgi:hypothetical protein
VVPEALATAEERTVRGDIRLRIVSPVALLLHYCEHLSHHEIGEITGCPERGVETRPYRARRRLRDSLADRLNEATRP